MHAKKGRGETVDVKRVSNERTEGENHGFRRWQLSTEITPLQRAQEGNPCTSGSDCTAGKMSLASHRWQ